MSEPGPVRRCAGRSTAAAAATEPYTRPPQTARRSNPPIAYISTQGRANQTARRSSQSDSKSQMARRSVPFPQSEPTPTAGSSAASVAEPVDESEPVAGGSATPEQVPSPDDNTSREMYDRFRNQQITQISSIKFKKCVPDGLRFMFLEFLERFASLWTLVYFRSEAKKEGLDLVDITCYFLCYKNLDPDGPERNLFSAHHHQVDKIVRDMCRARRDEDLLMEALRVYDEVEQMLRDQGIDTHS